jgi:hypothetical protein
MMMYCVQFEFCNVVVWWSGLSANDVAPLPGNFRDLCRILAFPASTYADLHVGAPRLFDAIVTLKGLDKRWVLPINSNEMEEIQLPGMVAR